MAKTLYIWFGYECIQCGFYYDITAPELRVKYVHSGINDHWPNFNCMSCGSKLHIHYKSNVDHLNIIYWKPIDSAPKDKNIILKLKSLDQKIIITIGRWVAIRTFWGEIIEMGWGNCTEESPNHLNLPDGNIFRSIAVEWAEFIIPTEQP